LGGKKIEIHLPRGGGFSFTGKFFFFLSRKKTKKARGGGPVLVLFTPGSGAVSNEAPKTRVNISGGGPGNFPGAPKKKKKKKPKGFRDPPAV